MKKTENYQRLLGIMDELREKCPWDKKQTIESLRTLTIEELYELSDAILAKDWKEIEKELGDVLLHIIFYAKIGEEKGEFSMESIAHEISEKLVFRHPHIYGDIEVKNEQEVSENWEKLKLKEGKKSVLEGVPNSLPAMIKAYRMQQKAKGVGFEWDNTRDVIAKLKEEIAELEEEIENQNLVDIEKEMGDVLFSMINLSRFLKVNPEDALEKTNRKFKNRFMKMEELAKSKSLEFSELELETQEELWKQTKTFFP